MMIDRLSRYGLTGLSAFLAITAIFGGIAVVPGLPREYLTGTPFPDYIGPALALAVIIGGGALAATVLLVIRPVWGAIVSGMAGVAIIVFEIVETSVVGWDLWLHAVGLSPTGKGLAGVDASGIPAPLGVPLPLWLQPFYFVLGAVMLGLALRLWAHRDEARPGSRAPGAKIHALVTGGVRRSHG